MEIEIILIIIIPILMLLSFFLGFLIRGLE